jgi:hypothetical protein
LRQAYDYWQDQPGNYFPIKAPLSMKRDRPFNPYLLCDRTSHFDGREFSSEGQLIQLQPRMVFPRRVLAKTRSAIEPPCSPFSQIPDALLHVTEATQIVAFRENYQQPAQETKALRTVEADSQLVNCSRISYQQVIRILRSVQSKQELT